MGRYTGKSCRLLCMLALTATFFLVEIIVGYITNSLALVGDSYHMLSDVVALMVGFGSVRFSKKHSPRNTFGWARAEVLGALVNSVFLMALCFTIFVEALQRMFHDEHIHDPKLMLIVGSLGLAVNIIGLFLFAGHGHSKRDVMAPPRNPVSNVGHGGHGHSHGGSPDSEKKPLRLTPTSAESSSPTDEELQQTPSNDSDNDEALAITPKLRSGKSAAQLNMRGVFLHVLGDALGSVIVIISALVIQFAHGEWKYKIDPGLSIVLVLIILATTIPLLKESSLILLQTVPTHIQVKNLQEKLIENVEGVLAVHEFHVWQLAGNRIIASAHIRCQNLRDYMRIAEKCKEFFHDEGIHSTTIQPEFVEFEETIGNRDCVLECGPDKSCFADTCCSSTRPSMTSPELPHSVRQRSTSHNATTSSSSPNSPSKAVSDTSHVRSTVES